jgi:dihydroxy-acid dehydratase
MNRLIVQKINHVFNTGYNSTRRHISSELNKYSSVITQNDNARAMQYALPEITCKADLDNKPQIGIGSNWYESNPCNSSLNVYSQMIKDDIQSNDMIGYRFNTIGVSDGQTMGTPSMGASFPSREIIADSIEVQTEGGNYDALVLIPGCDKNMPGCMMSLFRLDRPGMIVYGGSMPPSHLNGDPSKPLDIVNSFEPRIRYLKGEIDLDERENIVSQCCSKVGGSCSGMFTANTMSSLIEVMGFSLPNGATNPNMSTEKFYECSLVGKTILNLLENDIKPSDILSKESFENAIKLVYVLGGSTNAIPHLRAMAKETNIELSRHDFNKFKHLPVLSDMRPHGQYVMNDLHSVGGMTKLIRHLIEEDIINGDLPTITGKTLSENYEIESKKESYLMANENSKIKFQQIILPTSKPFKKTSQMRILKGNFAPDGCISKINSEKDSYEGEAIVFDTEQEMLDALDNHEITTDHFVILRYQGIPVGCPEMLSPTTALIEYFGDDAPPLATDGRFSGGSKGVLVAHLPDAYNNTITTQIRNGDYVKISLDNDGNDTINVEFKNGSRNIEPKQLPVDHKPFLKKFSLLAGDFKDGFSTLQ